MHLCSFINFIYSSALPNLTKFGLRGEIRTHDLRYLVIAARIELASIVSISIALHYAKRCKTGVLPDCTTRRKTKTRLTFEFNRFGFYDCCMCLSRGNLQPLISSSSDPYPKVNDYEPQSASAGIQPGQRLNWWTDWESNPGSNSANVQC